MDPRGPEAVEGRRGDHEGHVGGRQECVTPEGRHCEGKSLRRKVWEGVSNEGRIHVVGNLAASEVVPGEGSGFGALVSVRGSDGGQEDDDVGELAAAGVSLLAELKIKPWETLLKNIQEGNKKIKWKDRRWDREIKQKFKNTKLEDQCTHRYKIYAEGAAWSVSQKYILACDSMAMFIEPKYYDFYTRSLLPLQHYWPISTKNMCKDIQFAVDWGNSHAEEAQKIGKEGSNYLQENLKMKLVYDYMFHLLKEYANLLRFKPIIPEGAIEVCSNTEGCPNNINDTLKEFMVESMVKSPSSEPPCALPSPYEPQALQEILHRKKSGRDCWNDSIKLTGGWKGTVGRSPKEKFLSRIAKRLPYRIHVMHFIVISDRKIGICRF
ncbi:O-glucosyltransferase rumi-like protein [Senna tora]|uniref:O-glucosyltransferase rumi-like protein n=1 Tax=Senna tora TaxID=362788 RepID=A0A834XHB8_9FABA|nr:O-glucosyltransferase rumi-like protein [Senna tora]